MPLQTEYNKDTIKESILNKLLRYYGCTIEDATPKQVYAAVASTVRDQIMLKWRFEKEARRAEKAKRLYYLSIEFLTGPLAAQQPAQPLLHEGIRAGV